MKPGPSGRTDNRGRADPETAAVSWGVGPTNHSGHDEGEAIYEKYQGVSNETKHRRGTEEGSEFGYALNGANGSLTVYDPGHCGSRWPSPGPARARRGAPRGPRPAS